MINCSLCLILLVLQISDWDVAFFSCGSVSYCQGETLASPSTSYTGPVISWWTVPWTLKNAGYVPQSLLQRQKYPFLQSVPRCSRWNSYQSQDRSHNAIIASAANPYTPSSTEPRCLNRYLRTNWYRGQSLIQVWSSKCRRACCFEPGWSSY